MHFAAVSAGSMESAVLVKRSKNLIFSLLKCLFRSLLELRPNARHLLSVFLMFNNNFFKSKSVNILLTLLNCFCLSSAQTADVLCYALQQ